MRVLVIQLVESFNFKPLLGISAHHPDAGKVFLRARGNPRKEVLNLLKSRVHLLSKILYRQRNQRHRHKQQQSQLPANREQDRHDNQDGEHGLQRIHDHRAGELPHSRQIIRGPGHQISGAMLVKE